MCGCCACCVLSALGIAASLLFVWVLPWLIYVILDGWQRLFYKLAGECASENPSPTPCLTHTLPRSPLVRARVAPPSPSRPLCRPRVSAEPAAATAVATMPMTPPAAPMCAYVRDSCCPAGGEPLLSKREMYCVLVCLRSAQRLVLGADWTSPRLVGTEIVQCADPVKIDGRVSREELPLLARDCFAVRGVDTSALLQCF